MNNDNDNDNGSSSSISSSTGTGNLTPKQRERRDELEKIIRESLGDPARHWDAAVALATIKEDPERLYQPYATPADYAREVLEINLRRYQQLVAWAEANRAIAEAEGIAETNHGSFPSAPLIPSERCFRPATSLPRDRLVAAYKAATINASQDLARSFPQAVDAEKKALVRERRTRLAAAAGPGTDDPRLSGSFHTADVLDGLPMVDDGSVDLVLTSPPFNLGLDYGDNVDDGRPHRDYLDWLAKAMAVCVRKVKPEGGRIIVNLPTTRGDRETEYVHPLWADLTGIMRDLGTLPYQDVTWGKPVVGDPRAAKGDKRNHGSYLTCGCPNILRRTEHVMVFCRGGFSRRAEAALCDITKEEWDQWVLTDGDLWVIPGDSQTKKRGHPCSFPEELVRRCLKIWGQMQDRVLDPFGGLGTTALVCQKLEREFIHIDINPEFTTLARKRVIDWLE